MKSNSCEVVDILHNMLQAGRSLEDGNTVTYYDPILKQEITVIRKENDK